MQSELTKLKSLEDKLLTHYHAQDKTSKKHGLNKKNMEVEDTDSSEEEEHTFGSTNVDYYMKHKSRTIDEEMANLRKQLQEVNPLNKLSHKKYK